MSTPAMPTALPLDLTGRTVFVAGGGSSGPGYSIGRAACITYARLGAKVCVADRDGASAEETTQLIRQEGGTAETFVGDVAVEADVERLFAEAVAALGAIDVLHHNVGIGKTGGVMETSPEHFDQVHGVNVRSLLLVAKQVLPSMAERGRGAIITISSVAGQRYLGYPHLSYAVTKAAVIHFTRQIAQQYASAGIRANCVVPGLIDTPRIVKSVAAQFSDNLEEAKAARGRQVPMGRMGTAWEIAHACAFLASDAASYVTGTELVVDGGITGKFA